MRKIACYFAQFREKAYFCRNFKNSVILPKNSMKTNIFLFFAMWAGMLTSCGLEMPQETKTSFETMTIEKKIVSRYMLDNSESAYKQAQASVAQAVAAVNRAKVNLGFCTITASVSGINK